MTNRLPSPAALAHETRKVASKAVYDAMRERRLRTSDYTVAQFAYAIRRAAQQPWVKAQAAANLQRVTTLPWECH